MSDGVKQCSKCGERKPVTEFWKDKHSADGRCRRCKDCGKAYNRLYAATATGRSVRRSGNRRYEASPEGRSARREREKTDAMKAWRRSYRLSNSDKAKARYAVGNALKRGHLVRQPCEVCGAAEGVEAHHDDYSKPLDVRWLCERHHLAVHGKEINR